MKQSHRDYKAVDTIGANSLIFIGFLMIHCLGLFHIESKRMCDGPVRRLYHRIDSFSMEYSLIFKDFHRFSLIFQR